jgi:hypothetical protein
MRTTFITYNAIIPNFFSNGLCSLLYGDRATNFVNNIIASDSSRYNSNDPRWL